MTRDPHHGLDELHAKLMDGVPERFQAAMDAANAELEAALATAEPHERMALTRLHDEQIAAARDEANKAGLHAHHERNRQLLKNLKRKR